MSRKSQGLAQAWRLTAAEGMRLIRSGDLNASTWAAGCIERIKARDGEVHAWSCVMPGDSTMSEPPPLSLPLTGVPIGIKDVIDTSDFPTEFNSPLYVGNRPTRDADCVSVLKDAGATIVGKTETVEFAAGGRKARTRNPHDLTRTPGGSSSGSAAAVADFHVPIAIGTQSAGSIIRPASYCGVFAMKPSWGTVGRAGVKPYAPTLDTVGWMARSLEDLQVMADVFDLPGDIAEDAGKSVAICRTSAWPLAEAATRDAIDHFVALLSSNSVKVVEIDLPPLFSRLIEARRIIAKWEGRASFLADFRINGDLLNPAIAALVRPSTRFSADAVSAAYDLTGQCRTLFDRLASQFAFVAAPSAAGEAPGGLESTGGTEFNETWTLLGVPVINAPLFRTPKHLPVGVSILGARFTDQRLLNVLKGTLARLR